MEKRLEMMSHLIRDFALTKLISD